MPKPQRFCIYCGGAGLTKEHLYADRFREHLPRKLTHHGIESQVFHANRVESSVKWRPGDTHGKQVRRVCEGCNGGWMRSVVDEAEADLIAMAENRSVRLSRKRQRALAAWAAMTVMTGEFIDPEVVAVPQEDRTYLMDHLAPPRHWRIWISAYTPSQRVRRWSHHVVALAMLPDERYEVGRDDAASTADPNSHSSTICFGEHLFIYVMGSKVAETIVRRWNFPSSIKPLMRQIWPAAADVVRWPPARRLEPFEANYVANEFFRRVWANLTPLRRK